MVVPILQVFGGGLGATQTARKYSAAALLARSKLAEAGVGEPLVEGETSGTFEEPGYRWRQTVSRDSSAPPESDEDDQSGAQPDNSRGISSAHNRGPQVFGDPHSTRAGSGRFGEKASGFGQGHTSFGSTGHAPFSAGGSSFATNNSSSSAARGATAGSIEAGQDSENLISYEVTVTVEWNGGRNALSLSTLRLGRRR